MNTRQFPDGSMALVCDLKSPYVRSQGKVLRTDENNGKVRLEFSGSRLPTERVWFAPEGLLTEAELEAWREEQDRPRMDFENPEVEPS